MEEEEEGLQEPINPYWFGEKYLLGVEYSEKAREALGLMMGSFGHCYYYVNPDDDNHEGRLIFQEEEEDDKEAQVQQQCCLAKEEEEEERSTSTIMPSFVKMLQESGVSHVESPSPSPPPLLFPVGLKEEGSFQSSSLLRLQHQKNLTQVLVRGEAVVVDHESTDQSCLTNQLYHDHVFKPVVVKEGTSSFGEYDGGPRAKRSHESEAEADAKRSCSTSSRRRKSSSSSSNRRKKRKMIVKREEELESQRMTHIAVERNRRRQMNDHLNSLRSLMPPSYLQRGDQASIIGGAIDFVKELEQLLESLEGHKRIISTSKKLADQGGDRDRDRDTTLTTSSFSSSSVVPPLEMNQMMMSGNNIITRGGPEEKNNMCSEGGRDAHGGVVVKVKVRVRVRVIQNHVNLKVEYCDENNRRPPPGQLLNAIVALENLRLTVLHLNITTFQPSSSSSSSVHYSFNLKVEDDCRVGSAAEIERSVHGIFNGSSSCCS